MTTLSHTTSSTSRLHSTSGRPAQTTNALGRSAPRRSPLPPAGTIPTTVMFVSLGGGRSAVAALVRLGDQVFQMRLGLVLLHVERIHQLGREDLLGTRVHLLLARREPLLGLADREVAHDLRQLEDVTGLDLLAVVLEAPVPVLRHLAHVVAKDGEHLLYVVLPDHAPEARLVGVAARDHHGHVVIKDLNGQVLALPAVHLL